MTAPPCVLVTGSSRGLGRGIAEQLAEKGFSVAIHFAANKTAAKETAESCRRKALSGDQLFPLVGGNVGDPEDRQRIMEQTLEALGHLDALVNNAGVAPKERVDLTEATEESFDEVIGINLKGPYFLSQWAAKWWLAHPDDARLSGGYKLIFIGSISAYTASVNRGEYCIAKAGLGMANALWGARLVKDGIQSVELRPGIMKTDMTSAVTEKYEKIFAETDLVPQKRWGTPEDVGLAVLSVLQGHFPFSTGEVINVDGGFHLKTL